MDVTFFYDEMSRQVRSSDPDIFVVRLTISKEQIHAFCLHWHGRRIVFNATGAVTGSLPDTHHDWLIIGVGKIHRDVPTYHFRSREEFTEAVRLVLNAMKLMPDSLARGEKPIISVEFSPLMKRRLSMCPDWPK